MLRDNEIKIDDNLSYLIGVLHSDGYIYCFNDRKKNKKYLRLRLAVAESSLRMAVKFQRILLNSLGKNVNIRKDRKRNLYTLETSVNRLGKTFQRWKEKIPEEIKQDITLFGAYLGGLIDGDGHIKIKNNIKDRIVPQCVIIIASSSPLEDVKRLVEKFFGCKVHFEYDHQSRGVSTCFYVSNKNISLIESYVFGNLSLKHKIETLFKFFEMKRACRDSNPNFWVSRQQVAQITSQQLLSEAQRPIR